MRVSGKTVRRALIGATAVLLLAVIMAPYWNLDRYGRQIQGILEKELRRRVSVGKVRLDLFGGPGFSLSDVVIHDEERVGREPLAYVTALEARIALSSLWSGKLQFASLRLVEPSVNLVKPASGPWNFEELLGRTLASRSDTDPRPEILVRSGRVNFKFGDFKSVFYFSNADVDMLPPRRGQSAWTLRFSGEPARTDRPAQRLGRISGRGHWEPDGRLQLTLELERSYLEEISTLLAGRDLGLRGNLTARAQVAGPASALRISGRGQLRDFRRWDLMPPQGGDWNFSYRGRWDLLSQQVALETAPEGSLPVTLHLRIFDYLSQPRWGILASFEDLPLDTAPALLRVLGADVPRELKLAGRASGALGYSSSGGLEGALAAQGVSLALPGQGVLHCTRAPVTVSGEQLRLGPLAVEKADNSQISLEASGSLDGSRLALRIASQRAAIPEQTGITLLPGLEPIPLLENFRGGAWRGRLRYERQGQGRGRWVGALDLSGTQLTLEGLATPVFVEEARLRLEADGQAIEGLRGRVGNTPVQAEYRSGYKASPSPHLRLNFEGLDLAELERVVAPLLDRREGILATALRLGRRPAPEWLRRRHVEGEFAIASLRSGGLAWGPASGRLRWNGLTAEILDLRVRVADATLTGRLNVDLTGPTAAYRFSGAFGPLGQAGGRWDAEGYVESAGLGDKLVENLRAEGAFLGHAVELTAGEEFDTVAGRFRLQVTAGQPQLKIEGLEATQGDAVFRGECRIMPDGRLNVQLRAAHKELRLAGTLWPLRLEPVLAR